MPTVHTRTTSLQETGKPVVKRNQKAGSVLSVVEQSNEVIEEESDKKSNFAEDENIKAREISKSNKMSDEK